MLSSIRNKRSSRTPGAGRIFMVLALTVGASFGQNGGSSLTVADVIAMLEQQLPESVILTRIKTHGKPFQLGTEELGRLKKAGASEKVMVMMLDPTAAGAPAASGPPPTPPPADPNNPDSPHSSGIYLYTTDREGKSRMVLLERAAYQGTKVGVLGYALTSGIKKAKSRAMIPGVRSNIRSTSSSPVFYFYFEEKAGGFGRSGFGATMSNPNQFALLKLEVRKSNRETVIAEVGITGASSGTDAKNMIPFKSERIRDGVFRVTPAAPLQAGEYCFLASLFGAGMGAGAAGAVDIFDFGISLE